MSPINEILKPSMAKLNMAIFLFIIVGYLIWPMLSSMFISNDILLGFPFPIRRFNLGVDTLLGAEPFSMLNVGLDFVFWYLVSAFYRDYQDRKSEQ